MRKRFNPYRSKNRNSNPFRMPSRRKVRQWETTFFIWLCLLGFGFTFLTFAASEMMKWSTQFHFPRDIRGWVLLGIVVCAFLWLCFRTTIKSKLKPISYINEKGYVVLYQEDELEHRHIAKHILNRDLYQNEIVHHINGKKTDNVIGNLCLMDCEKHEHFHSWLRWKKEKSGHYPSIGHQKNVLEREYGGTLLENLTSSKQTKSSI